MTSPRLKTFEILREFVVFELCCCENPMSGNSRKANNFGFIKIVFSVCFKMNTAS
jgi:hypothetical protein